MASIGKRGNRWRVQVRRNGVSKTQYFSSHKEARSWADRFEGMLVNDLLPAQHILHLDETLKRYRDEVTPTKRSRSSESYRIGKWLKDPVARRSMSDINSADIARWRDQQINEGAAPSTIKNGLTIISQVYRIAATEWGMTGLINPVVGLRMPQNRPARDRRLLPGRRGSFADG